MKLIAPLAVLLLPLLGACVSQTTVETRPADIAGASDAGQRAQIRTALSSEYFQRGQYAIAIEEAENAVRILPTYAPGHSMLGIIFMQLGDDARARSSFSEALRLAPNDPDLLNNAGWFECQKGDLSRSIGMFQQALRAPLYATPHRALFNLGICSRKIGQVAEAENYFRQTLQLQPQLQPALLNLAELTYQSGRYKEAGSYMAQYSRLQSSPDADALLLGVRIARSLGDKANADSYLLQLERRFPGTPQTRQARGGV